MTKKRNAFKAGLFILISIALAISGIVGIEGLDSFTEPGQKRTLPFSLAADLNFANLGSGSELPMNTALVGHSGGVGALLAKANGAIDNFSDTAAIAKGLLTKVDGHVDPIVEKYNQVADHTSEMMVAIRD